jgi:hypothetical protein
VWGAVAAAWGVVLVWAEHQVTARKKPFFVFWSAAWAWCGILLLNPLVWPYWLLLGLPLFLAYVVETTGNGIARAGPVFFSVCGLLAIMNWLQNDRVVHAGGSLVAVLCLMVAAGYRARVRDHTHLDHLADFVAKPASDSTA